MPRATGRGVQIHGFDSKLRIVAWIPVVQCVTGKSPKILLYSLDFYLRSCVFAPPSRVDARPHKHRPPRARGRFEAPPGRSLSRGVRTVRAVFYRQTNCSTGGVGFPQEGDAYRNAHRSHVKSETPFSKMRCMATAKCVQRWSILRRVLMQRSRYLPRCIFAVAVQTRLSSHFVHCRGHCPPDRANMRLSPEQIVALPSRSNRCCKLIMFLPPQNRLRCSLMNELAGRNMFRTNRNIVALLSLVLAGIIMSL